MATHEAPHPLKTSLWPFFDAVTVTSTPLLGDPQHIVGTQHEAVGWMSGRRRQRMTIRQFVAMELARLAGRELGSTVFGEFSPAHGSVWHFDSSELQPSAVAPAGCLE